MRGTFDDSLPGVREPTVLASGTIGVLPFHLVVYRTVDERMRIWHDAPREPAVFMPENIGIAEIYQFGVGNAVVILLGLTDYRQTDFDAVRNEVLRLRNR